ncbi:amidohydrolase family protein [Paenibacillus silvae]|uniref:amidohydrolase family protein n=1 Tax=Paenibacillus silvae TaxID=1325358 RepID=UPI00200323B3|nr:amidohydrolase family protein [Paenibacillus silvae]MCK6075221.1 amidohydrolase [Paenibacillus silvae]MCK6149608.1 amidohydrolase [Paenibacillus silvae]MCK6267906.1 amidohydrolase [Paenibacillus silvae]
MSNKGQYEDFFIVDADVHINETPEDLIPYCDLPWRKALESIVDVPRRYLNIPGFAPQFSGNRPFWPGGFDKKTVNTPEQLRQELTELGIDIAIIFPDNLLLIATFPQREYAAALARAYNAYLVDQWADRLQGLKGLILAAPQDPHDAAREIHKYKDEEGIVGVYLPCGGLHTLWGHEMYNPIFEAAEEAGLPVIFHSVLTLNTAFPFNGLEQFETEFARHALAHSMSLMFNMLRLIETGVPVRYPDLKMCFIEGGVSWVPYMSMRLDKEYMERRRYVQHLEKPPSHYIKNFYYGTQPIEEPENPSDLAKVIELYEGEDTTMFASDWPHHDFDHPRAIINSGLSKEVKRKILGENALAFFDIDRQGKRLRSRAQKGILR